MSVFAAQPKTSEIIAKKPIMRAFNLYELREASNFPLSTFFTKNNPRITPGEIDKRIEYVTRAAFQRAAKRSTREASAKNHIGGAVVVIGFSVLFGAITYTAGSFLFGIGSILCGGGGLNMAMDSVFECFAVKASNRRILNSQLDADGKPIKEAPGNEEIYTLAQGNVKKFITAHSRKGAARSVRGSAAPKVLAHS